MSICFVTPTACYPIIAMFPGLVSTATASFINSFFPCLGLNVSQLWTRWRQSGRLLSQEWPLPILFHWVDRRHQKDECKSLIDHIIDNMTLDWFNTQYFWNIYFVWFFRQKRFRWQLGFYLIQSSIIMLSKHKQ